MWNERTSLHRTMLAMSTLNEETGEVNFDVRRKIDFTTCWCLRGGAIKSEYEQEVLLRPEVLEGGNDPFDRLVVQLAFT